MENTNTPVSTENIDTPTAPFKNKTFLKFILPAVAVIVITAGGVGYYFYNQYKTTRADPQTVAQEETRQLVAAVGKLILLPSSETPTIATVSDPEKLKTQAFFVNAQKGDKVLIYPTSKKAILYRPSNKKIIEVAPINLGSPTTSPTSPSAVPSETPRKLR